MHRVVSVLGNNGLLQRNFVKHLKRNCESYIPIDSDMIRNETWRTYFTYKIDKNACLGIVFYEFPATSEDYVRQLTRYGIPYKRVWPAAIKRHLINTYGPPSPNIFLPNNPDWEAFIRDHTQSDGEIYV